jgi:hypothetical protein
MAFDKPTRNALARMVADCRRLLTNDVREQLQATYGIQPDGTALAVDKLTYLDDRGLEIATALREWLEHLFASEAGTEEQRRTNAFFRMTHETAFTYLNRLAALRMCEERGLVIECVRRGTESDGFALYERLASQLLGDRGQTYRVFLDCMFDELAVDLGVLFDRHVPHSLVFPTPACIASVLQRLNDKELAHLWQEDETIGWLYQYFNSREEIDRMRKKELGGSPSPRNSRELAVRNQFFTPRYVVEFLTDNTLGRIWYEMQRGATVLKDECRYLVRRPHEIFLGPDEQPPATESVNTDLPQEELLQRPVYILHRARKDPRDLKILDPACGSGHFLLYAFDLLEHIYIEAWQDASAPASEITGKSLRDESDYKTEQALLSAIPGLIMQHNLHGIDIDPRACQIAALSLWLRAQRSYQKLGLKALERPPITKINVVCAEPMPGEEDFLEEFIAKELSHTPEQEAIAHFVRQVFARMKLAGEAGALLKIEKDISEALTSARQQCARQAQRAQDKQGQALLFTVVEMDQFAGERQLRLDFSDITDAEFWDQAEKRIVDALRNFAEQVANGASLKRGLFSGDAAQGFAFIDVCRTRYDAVVMNPPFGDASLPSKPYIEDMYADTKGDVYKAFVECFQDRLVPAGMLGIISSRQGFFLGQSADWRERIVLQLYRPIALADLGSGVLDAMVETAAYVLRALSNAEDRQLILRLLSEVVEVPTDKDGCFSIPKYQQKRDGLKRHQAEGEIGRLLQTGYLVEVPGHFRRFQPQDNIIRSASAPRPESFDELMCFHLIDVEDKGDQLAEAIQSLPLAQTSHVTHVVNPTSFRKVPGAPFAYWVSDRLRRLFTELPFFEAGGRVARQGGVNGDDFRWLRLWTEVKLTLGQDCYVPTAKGGKFSPFYADLSLIVRWDFVRDTFWAFTGLQHRPTLKPASFDFYFRPGLTWPRRTQSGLALRVLPTGCIFADKGPAVFVEGDDSDDLLALLAIANSLAFRQLINLQMAFGSYEVGVIQRTPVPVLTLETTQCLATLAHRAWSVKYSVDTASETSHAFRLPALCQVPGERLTARALAWAERVRESNAKLVRIQTEIDEYVFDLYGIYGPDREKMLETVHEVDGGGADTDYDDEDNEELTPVDATELVAQLLSYGMGLAFNRFDVALALDERRLPPEPDPFAPLPVCSPGMLMQANGLPAEPGDIAGDYPLRISWSGILVDDDGHADDIIGGIRHALEVIWPITASEIEQEACDLLGVKSLRDYIARPNGFFADHLKRYFKSRRKAPLYWPLSTASGSYSVWVYYHRLTDQTLYTIVNRYIEPKVEDVQRRMVRIEEDLPTASGAEATRLRDALYAHRKLLDELQDMKQELLRVAALPYKPDLNDGVIINAAPLYKLFQHRAWAKDCADCWKKLEKGDYDWSHMAFNLWPERVREKCKQDRSLAIAHGLEDICEVPLSVEKKTRKRPQSKT